MPPLSTDIFTELSYYASTIGGIEESLKPAIWDETLRLPFPQGKSVYILMCYLLLFHPAEYRDSLCCSGSKGQLPILLLSNSLSPASFLTSFSTLFRIAYDNIEAEQSDKSSWETLPLTALHWPQVY